MELKIAENFSIDANEIVTNRVCVIGQSGSGKSYSIAVICEELLRNQIGFTIVDTEGEYFSLKQKFKIIWIGKDRRADLDIDEIDLKSFAEKVVKNRLPVIFDVSEVEDPKEKVNEFLTAIYNFEDEIRSPYLIILEEADKFIPQRGEKIKIVDEIARRGRKRGLGLLIATQRPSLVDKNILSQCAISIIGKLTIENDLKAVSIFFNDREQLLELPKLNPGEFFFNGKKIKFRKRITEHKAITPKVIPWKFEKVEFEKKKNLGIPPKEFEGKLIWLPIYEVKLKSIRHSLFGNQIVEYVLHFYKDSIVKLLPLRIIVDLKKIKNLGSNEIEILKKLKDGDDVKSLLKKVEFSESTLRKALRNLEKAGIIISKEKPTRYFKVERIEFNKIEDKEVKLSEVNGNANYDYSWVKEFVKKLDPNAVIEKEITFLYPIYEAEKKLLFKKILVRIDGPTLKKITL